MWQAIKNFLKRILPPPARAFNREIARILAAVESVRLEARQEAQALHQEQQQSLAELNELRREQRQALAEIKGIRREQTERFADYRDLARKHSDWLERQADWLQQQTAMLDKLAQEHAQLMELRARQQEQMEVLGARMAALDGLPALVQQEHKTLSAAIQGVSTQAQQAAKYSAEAVWGEVFNNTISGSPWLLDRAFSPGRWAVGYPALYVIYRVLNEARPKRILELGLGQSTRMIGQYAAAFPDVEHTVVEHDQDWINFFQNSFPLSDRSEIVHLEREMVPYKEAEAVRVFQGFGDKFQDRKFDFIFIDAPLGADMKQYSRIDILSVFPQCLKPSFVVLLDDYERVGEQNTGKRLEEKLKEQDIPYCTGRQTGEKRIFILASPDYRFLTTL